MEGVPRIVGVEPKGQSDLLVRFESGVDKLYDCSAILGRPEFALLRTAAFFRAVRVDPGGYGVSWNDDMDLSGYDLWVRGVQIN